MDGDVMQGNANIFHIAYVLGNGDRLEHMQICERIGSDRPVGKDLALMQVYGFVDTGLNNTKTAKVYGLTPKGFKLAYLTSMPKDLGVEL